MTKEGISESEAQKLLYTGGFTIEATVNTKLQSQMENLISPNWPPKAILSLIVKRKPCRPPSCCMI